MHILTLYSGIADTLTPEDIGNKILPGLIPMLISASFTKTQFSKLISTIRTLIDQLEKHRLKDLSEMDPLGEGDVGNAQSNQKDIFGGFSTDDPLGSLPPQNNDGDFGFLSQIEGTTSAQAPKTSGIGQGSNKAASNDPFAAFGSANTQSSANSSGVSNKNDIFKGIGSAAPNTMNTKPANSMSLGGNKKGGFDPFDTSGPSKPLAQPGKKSSAKSDVFADMDPFSSQKTAKADPFSTGMPAKADPFSTQKPAQSDPFSNLGGSKPVSSLTGMPSVSINMSTGFKSLNDGSDPFADIGNEDKKENNPSFAAPSSNFNFSSDLGGNSQNSSNLGNKNTSDPFAGFGGSKPLQKPPSSTNSSTGFGFGGSNAPSAPASTGFGMGAPPARTGGSNPDPFSNFNSPPVDNSMGRSSNPMSNTGISHT